MSNDNQPTNTVSFEEAVRYYLTDAEIRVLKRIAKRFTCKEIAASFGNKVSTIQTHRKNIKRKLNLNGYRSLERWCDKYAEEIRYYQL